MLTFLTIVIWLVIFLLLPLVVEAYNFKKSNPSKAINIASIVWFGFGIVAAICWSNLISIWTTSMWFTEVGFTSVYWTRFFAGYKCGAIAFPIIALFIGVNFWACYWPFSKEQRKILSPTPLFGLGIVLVVSLLIATIVGSTWPTILLALNQTSFGIPDPVFGKDISFYVFTVPFLEICRNTFIWTVLITAGIVSLAQTFQADMVTRKITSNKEANKVQEKLDNYFHSHLAILGIFLLISFAFGTMIAKWNLLYSTRGVVLGAGWTDIHVQLPAYNLYIVGLAICCLILFASARAKSKEKTTKRLIWGFGLCAGLWFLGVLAIPQMVQQFKVEPSEVTYEQEYIKKDMEFTRAAYGIDDKNLKQSSFPVKDGLAPNTLEKDKVTLKNVRLWDWQILNAINLQKECPRNYYSFPDTDVVRYKINGQMVSLMSSVRELDQKNLTQAASTWVNKHFVYTHGYGACANPVNTVLPPSGYPDYWVNSIPVISKYPALELKEPRIYFGEATKDSVFVNSKMAEFDYPFDKKNVTISQYKGSGGIVMDSWLKKFAFACKDNDLRILNANEITTQTKIMFDRDIRTRVDKIAPFLNLDSDPYQVIADGKIWYIWDAYTTTDMYPYSAVESLSYSNEQEIVAKPKLNYIRNSVKIVIDAYNGSVSFYVFDPKDPIISAYGKIFPGLLKAKEDMPQSLLSHIRYPQDLLEVQSRILCTYHMSDPTVFYNKEDVWAPASMGDDTTMEPYYIVMKLPGEEKEEFVQILPFTPITTNANLKRLQMVGWLAARCDPEHYGELILFDFPKGQLPDGPAQIKNRLNQHEVASKDITLWGQNGSEVLFGNLLIIPLSDSRLLSVQTLFIKGKEANMPELKRVFVTSGSQSVYAPTFAEAIAQLAGTTTLEQVPTQVGNPASKTKALSPNDLPAQAQAHLDKYQAYSSQGRFTEAGKELDALKSVLKQLSKK